MKETKRLSRITLLVFLLAHSLAAYCAAPAFSYDILSEEPLDTQPALIVHSSRTPIITIPGEQTEYIVDTMYRADLTRRLVKEYSTCDIAVVAKVTRVLRHTPPQRLNEPVYPIDSVTVVIESVLKGVIKPVWNFTVRPDVPSTVTILDPETGDTIEVTQSIKSHYNPTFTSVLNHRFLLFLNKEDISPDTPLPIPLPQFCIGYSYGYKLTASNNIYYDGMLQDTANQSMLLIPELMCPYNEFTAQLSPSSVSTPQRRVPPRLSEGTTGVITSYNLLGRRIPPHSGRHLPTATGMHVTTIKKSRYKKCISVW